MTYKMLLRLYPRSWRQRYAEEFLALLEEAAPTGRARFALVADVLRGAADARLGPVATMARSFPVRSGALAGAAAPSRRTPYANASGPGLISPNVSVDPTQAPAAESLVADPAERPTRLEALHHNGLLTDAEHQDRRAKIIEAL